MAERLELVERFEELSSGMEVVDLYCEHCGRAMCRVTLTELEWYGDDPLDDDDWERAWSSEPDCNPESTARGNFSAITRGSVQERHIFRVVRDEGEGAERSRARELEDALG